MASQKADAAARFNVLDASRKAHLDRQRECASLTLPFLLPPDGTDENTELKTPWQSLGARCVNNLASKIVLTLMPPNNSCFRLVIDESVKQQMLAQIGEGAYQSQVEEKLSLREIMIQSWMEKSKIRPPAYRIMRLLIATGNALTYRHPKRVLKVYRLDQYVVRRDGVGDPIEIIVKDMIDIVDLPPGLKEGLEAKDTTGNQLVDKIPAYTYCLRKGDTWHVHQEVNGKTVPNTKSKFTIERFPFHPLVWNRIDGENYGRGHVEEYLGDVISLEELRKAVIETTAAGAKLVFLRNPNGIARKKDLIDARNGDFVDGSETDVTTLKVEKVQDLQVAAAQIGALEDSLSKAFLLHTSIQRQGERVTAEEIRFMAQDIEDALGGIYSNLSADFQLPLVNWAVQSMEDSKELEPMPKSITITVTTGIEALGRGHDLQKLLQFMNTINITGPQVVAQYLIIAEFYRRVATSLGINVTGLIKTEQQLQQEMAKAQQAQQQQQMLEVATKSGAIKEAVAQQMGNGQPQEQPQE